MAGIAWKLEQLLARNTLSSTLQAYLTGVAVTSAPWLLTTAVLVTLRLVASDHATPAFVSVEQLIAVAYATTLVLSAPVHVVLSRFTADRLYEKRLNLVGSPLWTVFACSLLAFLAVGVAITAILGLPIELAVPGAVLTSIIAGQWLLLAVGGGMCSPAGVLGAFASGAAISVVCALVLEEVAGLGARGYLTGFTFGQATALTGMLVHILRSLPDEDTRVPRPLVRRAFRDYRLLACSAFAIHAAVWVDKLATLGLRGGTEAARLTNVSALAWFSLIPTFAWTYVHVETAFYRVFVRYFRGIEAGASLRDIEQRAVAVRAETKRLFQGAMTIQTVATAFCYLVAPHFVAALGLAVDAAGAAEATLALRLSLVAASLQMLTLLALLLLYYLDLRRKACAVALAQLAAVTLSAVGLLVAGEPSALGAAIGSLLPAVYALAAVHSATANLVRTTFQSQTYGHDEPDC